MSATRDHVAGSPASEPGKGLLRSILRLTPLPAKAAELIGIFVEHDVFGRAGRTDGYRGGEVQVAVDGAEVVVTATWDSVESYGAWLESPERGAINERLAPLLAAGPTGTLYEIVLRHEGGR
jgi:heme-degrading monooxygenase HmoA